MSGTTQTALARTDPLNVSLCGPDAGGISLGAGTHTLAAAYGDTLVNNQLTTGFDLDQLALDSAPGGAPAPPVSASAIAAPPAQPATNIAVTSKSATTMHLRVSGAKAPFELVMGQSVNDGWTANLAGAGSLGPSVLLDGFANGWKVTAADLAKAGPSGSFDVTLRWTPQTRVDVGLIVSALTILACLLMAYLPERWRRRIARRVTRVLRPLRRRRTRAAHARSGGTEMPAGLGEAPAPRLWTPFRPGRPPTGWVTALSVAVATGLVGALISRPLTGVAAGAATLVALLVPRARLGLGLAAVGLMVAAGTYTIVEQSHLHASLIGGWASNFSLSSNLAWAAVVFLGADAVVEIVRRLASARASAGRPAGRAPGGDAVDPPDMPGTSGESAVPAAQGAPGASD